MPYERGPSARVHPAQLGKDCGSVDAWAARSNFNLNAAGLKLAALQGA